MIVANIQDEELTPEEKKLVEKAEKRRKLKEERARRMAIQNPQKAAAIGLLPKQLINRTTAVGNTSLAGAVDVLRDGEALAGMQHICAATKEIILGNTSEFQKLYIQYMDF